jgi:hypothetical protein
VQIITIVLGIFVALIIVCELLCDGNHLVFWIRNISGYSNRPWEYKNPHGYKYYPPNLTVLKKFPQNPPYAIAFYYTKRDGEEIRRTIHVRQVFEYYSLYSGRESYYIKGYCTTRQAERTFNDYRISNLIDLQTGEVFDLGRDFILPIFHAWYEKNQKRKILRIRAWLLKGRRQIGKTPIVRKIDLLIWRWRQRGEDYENW